MGELQLTTHTFFTFGSVDEEEGHCAGHPIFLRKHGLPLLKQTLVSARLCTIAETKNIRMINKLLLLPAKKSISSMLT
jgi:hypothetical protein